MFQPQQPRMPGPAAAAPQSGGQSMAQPAPQPGAAPGGGAPQPQGSQAQAAGNPNAIPPDLMRSTLMARLNTMSAQDAQALYTGVTPQAMQVLKRWIPEIEPLWDKLLAKQGGGAQQPGAAPAGGGDPASRGAADAAASSGGGPGAQPPAGSQNAPPPQPRPPSRLMQM